MLQLQVKKILYNQLSAIKTTKNLQLESFKDNLNFNKSVRISCKKSLVIHMHLYPK
jgi:hypothetical protein